ncbi:hypothetical protein FH972_025143 [Carpinus fangiana]|uniref:LNS2/PITP domain-containing protein n=1 Tax=Carpinus fangiana TaxID=176857 RepID=A0A5N6L060_9ROSI|nr:hypothetical protein FH972_025143 [Carpinus fangiana]
MNYVRSISGSVSKTWNSINPATLSGAIDVIVVEQEDGSMPRPATSPACLHADPSTAGTLACSPFHVRFGKFQLLRPSEKKVEFYVNNIRQDYAMKLGEGGEAFFVFETSSEVPENLQTSPLVSPVTSPETRPVTPGSEASLPNDLQPLDDLQDISGAAKQKLPFIAENLMKMEGQNRSDSDLLSTSLPQRAATLTSHEQWVAPPPQLQRGNSAKSELVPPRESMTPMMLPADRVAPEPLIDEPKPLRRINSPPLLPRDQALHRALTLSEKLKSSNIPSTVNDEGDLMLDITGYKSSEEEEVRAEVVARKLLAEEVEGNYDIGSLIGTDEKGNLWIYSSEESKEAAAAQARKSALPGISHTVGMLSSDAISDPGYHSDDAQSQQSFDIKAAHEQALRESDSTLGSLSSPPESPLAAEPSRNYAKTLRLSSDQLKAMDLKPGPNPMSFSVNRSTCQGYMYLWRHDVPIVVSDVDGTITKSDALGHVLNMIGRDWTHLGVAKLYTDIIANGYNIFYLTSRSVGQADTTRTYLQGINQEGYRLPRGPVILSPDRTIAALRREIYLRKPEVFKMACLRDLMALFGSRKTPFYAGFGNRLTDALSYRSVNIPPTRIFTINSNAEVSLDLLTLNKFKTGYVSMREIVDHYFPPVGMLVHEGGEEYTDFNYWREAPRDIDEFSMTDSESGRPPMTRQTTYDDGSDMDDEDDLFSDDMADSYLSRESTDIRQSIESEGIRRNIGSVIGSDDESALDEVRDDNVEALDALDLNVGASTSTSAR